MLTALHLVMICGFALASSDTGQPSELVKQLGAGRFSDREEAAKALEQLGRAALPALREARDDKDLEVRTRAGALIDRIESDLMVRPTLVKLDFVDQPVADVVKAISERSGISLGLVNDADPIWRSRRVTLQAEQPVTFWHMIDRLTKAARVQQTVVMAANGNGRSPMFQFLPGGEHVEFPTSYSGPFRVLLSGVHVHRDLNFGSRIVTNIQEGVGVRRQVAPVGLDPNPAQGPVAQVQFTLDLQIQSEPRMSISKSNGLKLTEAIDDLGQSLLYPNQAEGPERYNSFYGGYGSGLASTTLQVSLRAPDQIGRAIKRLRGTVPLVVTARKDVPVVIDLADAKGKTARSAELTVTVHDLRPNVDQFGSTELELTIRSNTPNDPALGPAGRAGFEMLSFRGPQAAQNQIEILDAQGRPHLQIAPRSIQTNNEESRMTLRLMPNAQVGAPAQLKVYDLARATTEASFEFRDVPIP